MSGQITTGAAELEAVVAILRSERTKARAEGVELVGVVGSVARREATPDSDIDVVVRKIGRVTLFSLERLESALQRRMGRPVELVFSEAMAADRRAFIERDLVPL